ncbi:MAG: metallophosphoesterase family protein [Hyphomicrobiales bacterium]
MIKFFSKFSSSKAITRDPPALAPEGLRIYAVGDIHGRADLLDEMLKLIEEDLQNSPTQQTIEVFLGDYIDRGPEIVRVIETLMSHSPVCDERICLKGNHEDALLRFLDDSRVLTSWRNFGGIDTLYAYGVKPALPRNTHDHESLQREFEECFPTAHLKFLEELPLSTAYGDYFFVHAGVRPEFDLDAQEEEDLLWIRGPFLESKADFGKVIIHGHTPQDEPDVKFNRINIDTGAWASGKLTCIVLEGQEQRFLSTQA